MHAQRDTSPAQAMDAIYRYQRHIYDATRAHYLLGRNAMIADLKPPPGGSVLEIGCGTGRNLALAAERYPSARLYGFDISAVMLETARRSLVRKGVDDRVTLATADATAFDASALFGREKFDRVCISYALSMIPQWRDVVRGAMGCITVDGSLHIVDFGDFAGFPAIARRAQMAWLHKFQVVPISGLDAELGAIAKEYGCKLKSVELYGGYAVLAHLAPLG